MVPGVIAEVALAGGLVGGGAIPAGAVTVPLPCIYPDRHVNADAHPSAWLHLRFNTYCCTCGVRLLAKELALALGVPWPLRLPRTLTPEQVWNKQSTRDIASAAYLRSRGLGGVLALPEAADIVRFNIGSSGDMAVDNLAWARYRIACAIRTIRRPSAIQSVQFRMAGQSGRRSKTMNLRGVPVRGGAFLSPSLVNAMSWPESVVIVEGMADFFAACIRGWSAIGMPGVEFAGSLAESIAPLVNGREVYLAPHRDEPGERAMQTIINVLSGRSNARLSYADFRQDVKDLAEDLHAELTGGPR